MIKALSYTFMQNALVASFLSGLGCGLIGVWVVLFRIPFIGVAMSHAAFAGAAVGMLLGLNPLISAIVGSILAASLIGPLSDSTNIDTGLAMAIVFSLLVGVAFLAIGLMKGPKSEALNLLWGNILTVQRKDLIPLGLSAVAALAFSVLFHAQLRAIVFNRIIARVSGIPDKALIYITLLLAGITVSVNLRTIGGLLLFSLIINPPLAAYYLTYNLTTMLLLSVLFATASSIVGLGLSYAFDLPSGSVIILVSGLILLLSGAKKLRSGTHLR